jgi:hypothetical protein
MAFIEKAGSARSRFVGCEGIILLLSNHQIFCHRHNPNPFAKNVFKWQQSNCSKLILLPIQQQKRTILEFFTHSE